MLVDSRVLIIATSRTPEAVPDIFHHELALAPLSPSEVGELTVDSGVNGALLFAATGGNPFFIEQVLRVALSDAALQGSTDGLLATVVEKRIGALPDETEDALVALAVLGASPVGRLARLTGTGSDAVADALRPAMIAGIVEADAEASSDVRFTHDLHAEVLRGAIAPGRLRALHATAAGLWEGVPNSLPRV